MPEHCCNGSRRRRRGRPHLALDFPGVLVVNGAANADAGAQDLLDGASQLARTAAVTHDARNLNHLVQLQVAAVLDVLLLQAQPTRAQSWKMVPSFIDMRAVITSPKQPFLPSIAITICYGSSNRSMIISQPTGHGLFPPSLRQTSPQPGQHNNSFVTSLCISEALHSSKVKCKPGHPWRSYLLAIPNRLFKSLDNQGSC